MVGVGVKILHLSGPALTLSSQDSIQAMICANLFCAKVRNWVTNQCGSVEALSGWMLLPVGSKQNYEIFCVHIPGRKSDYQLIDFTGLVLLQVGRTRRMTWLLENAGCVWGATIKQNARCRSGFYNPLETFEDKY